MAGAPASFRKDLEGDRRSPYSEKQRKLVLCFREYDAPMLFDPDLTGILLSLVYTPSARAYRSLESLNYQWTLGWLLRAMHYWGSNCMVIVMFLHMTQVFLWGAYKYPRELTWISGVVLLVLTLGIAFTGQVMRFDSDAYWGVGIGAAVWVEFRSSELNSSIYFLGGPIIGTDTLSRFFALHVFVLPGSILALVSLHLRLVLLKGINEYPKPGIQVNRQTYDEIYEETVHKEGIPVHPERDRQRYRRQWDCFCW